MRATAESADPAGAASHGMIGAMAAAGYACVEGSEPPLFQAEAIAAALVDRDARLICASPAFEALGGVSVLDAELIDRAAGGQAVTGVASLAGRGDSAAFAYAPASRAAAWRLPAEVAEAARSRPGAVVVVSGHAGGPVRPLEDACRAYGLTGLQTRVALATIRAGHVRQAAESLGIAYDTAREALAAAMRRVQTRRLPALVARLTSVAFGILSEDADAEILGDLWGLSARQAAIAGLVAEGLSRSEAAAALRLSEAVVKKELDRVYLVLQADSAAALARKLVEARALGWLIRATAGDVGYAEPAFEPQQFVARPDGGRIAISDYGPPSGQPVIVSHPSINGRFVPRRLLRALQGAGRRVIAIDRPGFGLSDEHVGKKIGAHDCWTTAAEDTLTVLDALRIPAADLVASQGGGQYVVALGRLAPQRLGRVVMINPDPHAAASTRRVGLWGIMKEAYRRWPAMIPFSVAMISRQFSYELMVSQCQAAARGSPPDEAAYADPEICLDVFRAMRPLATGRNAGVVNEEIAIARGPRPAPLRGATDWVVLVGEHDTLHDPDEVLAYYRLVLPDAAFRKGAGAGRLLATTHSHYVVEALQAG